MNLSDATPAPRRGASRALLRRLVVACAVALPLAAASTAFGASVTHTPGSEDLIFRGDPGEGNQVMVTSAGGTLTVTDAGAATLGAAGNCGGVDARTVSCPAAGITGLDLSGGDRDDKIVNATSVAGELEGDEGDDVLRGGGVSDQLAGGADADDLDGASGNDHVVGGGGEDYLDGRRGADALDGGPGPDVVVARDGARDQPVSCGTGQDYAIVDRRDRVVRSGKNRCEQVDDGMKTKPRPGRVYVKPEHCAAAGGWPELGLPAMHRLVPLQYSLLLRTGFRRRPPPWFDASDCPVRLTATPGQGRRASAHVSGGAARLAQTAGRRVATLLNVVPPDCTAGGSGRAAKRRPARLRVATGRRQGRWRVRGKYSLAASFGTDWTTIEGCLQTTTIVRRGRVQVYDAVKRRTVVVRAGHEYVARAR
jgi:hypothetical protein